MATKTAVTTDLSGFRQMIDSITDHEVIRLDPEGRVCSWHIGAERLTGYLADEILGRSLAVFYSPEDVTAGQPERELEAAMRDGQCETEGWRVRKDGTRLWASVVLSPIRDQNGRLEGYVKIARDLTDRREQEQTLQRQREATPPRRWFTLASIWAACTAAGRCGTHSSWRCGWPIADRRASRRTACPRPRALSTMADSVTMMRVGENLLVALRGDLDDSSVERTERDVTNEVAQTQPSGVLLNVSGLIMVDSYVARVIARLVTMIRLLGGGGRDRRHSARGGHQPGRAGSADGQRDHRAEHRARSGAASRACR